jgi:hypothetical protein
MCPIINLWHPDSNGTLNQIFSEAGHDPFSLNPELES